MGEKLEIEFLLPSKESFSYDLTGSSHLYVKDVKFKLYLAGISIHPMRMTLLHNRQVMRDELLLSEYPLQTHPVVDIIQKVVDVAPLFFRYDEFLASVSPSPEKGSHQIPINSTFEMVFQPNLCQHIINTESLLNRNCLKTIYYDADRQRKLQPQQMKPFLPAKKFSSEFSEPEMQRHHPILLEEYKQWTDYAPETNVLLLKVDETLSLRVDRILYNLEDVLCGKMAVDEDSWQRYTRWLPVDCEVQIDNKYSECPLHVRLIPFLPLEYNTHYAVFLKCGVATIPVSEPRNSLQFCSDGVGWDKLILYRTERGPAG